MAPIEQIRTAIAVSAWFVASNGTATGALHSWLRRNLAVRRECSAWCSRIAQGVRIRHGHPGLSSSRCSRQPRVLVASLVWWTHDGQLLGIPKTTGPRMASRACDSCRTSTLYLNTDSTATVRYSDRGAWWGSP
jgi:hypothetical protein